MASYGLLGRKLGHSFSPQIHNMLCGYDYGLYEAEPEELADFLASTPLAGMNVTMPYKKDVIPFCSALSDAAKRIGSVNTLVRRGDGWYGDNTDYFGFSHMVKSAGVDPRGKKCLVLGSGGASLTVQAALADMGAGKVVVISRGGENNYNNLYLHADADIIVNTTPVGMYPNTGVSAVSLGDFPRCAAVLDIIFNPARTALLLEAESLGIKAVNGLSMLVAQAHRAAEIFTGRELDPDLIGKITAALEKQTRNIVLIGMPGCGKTKKGRRLAEITGREFLDADLYLAEKTGKTPEEIILSRGEEAFRKAETAVLAELCRQSGKVIATGGGCVTREENYPILHQNSVIVWVKRPISQLPTDGRPISKATPLSELYEKRKSLYSRFADAEVDVCESIDAAAKAIKEMVL